MEKKRRYFPDAFKRQAVARVETGGLHLFEVVAELGVHESQRRRWARQVGQAGALTTHRHPTREMSGPSPADLVAENAHLKRELQRAEAERGILNNAAAIFATATR